jgi:hypothetical protein
MNKFRIIVRTSILLVLSLFVFKSMYVFTAYKQYNEHLDTGTVISRSADDVVIKHGTSTELYLNIKFDKSGFRSMNVAPTTYFKFEKGSRVSFNLKDITEEGNSVYFIMGAFFYFIAGIVGLVMLIIWAFNIKF